jgi:hypothetical protein
VIEKARRVITAFAHCRFHHVGLGREFSFSIMVPLVGLVLMALGLCLAVTAWAEFVAVARAVTALLCLVLGAILLLVGASERKARREYRDAITNDPEADAKT